MRVPGLSNGVVTKPQWSYARCARLPRLARAIRFHYIWRGTDLRFVDYPRFHFPMTQVADTGAMEKESERETAKEGRGNGLSRMPAPVGRAAIRVDGGGRDSKGIICT